MELKKEFREKRRKSKYICQYKCVNENCNNRWWDGRSKSETMCRQCQCTLPGAMLSSKNTFGVGWFNCQKCGHLFSKACRGNVALECRCCHTRPVSLLFIIPGNQDRCRRSASLPAFTDPWRLNHI